MDRKAFRRAERWLILALALLVASAQPTWAATLERVAETKQLRIGHREDAPPFSFKASTGEVAGYTIELCRRIADDLKAELGLDAIEIEYVAVEAGNRFQAIADGDIDLLCGSTTATLSRRELVSFSIPTFITGVSALMRGDAPQFLREVLSGRRPSLPPRKLVQQAFVDRKFGVRSDTTAEEWLQVHLSDLATNAEMIAVASHDEGLRLVQEGEIDAYFGDRAILVGLVSQSAAPQDFEIGERFFTFEPYALAMAKGDEAFRLSVDRSLSRLYRSVEIDRIFADHFGTPSPSVRALFQINSLPE